MESQFYIKANICGYGVKYFTSWCDLFQFLKKEDCDGCRVVFRYVGDNLSCQLLEKAEPCFEFDMVELGRMAIDEIKHFIAKEWDEDYGC